MRLDELELIGIIITPAKALIDYLLPHNKPLQDRAQEATSKHMSVVDGQEFRQGPARRDLPCYEAPGTSCGKTGRVELS